MKRKVKIKTGALLLNYSATMRGFEKDGELKLLMDDEEAMERRRGCWKDGWRERTAMSFPPSNAETQEIP